ncbi:MAG: hypothetical protein MZV49_25700 [Rhodopseudomonas palustris]|nr:hypothetical protein [Rhodopseudomonas palustris]
MPTSAMTAAKTEKIRQARRQRILPVLLTDHPVDLPLAIGPFKTGFSLWKLDGADQESRSKSASAPQKCIQTDRQSVKPVEPLKAFADDLA